MLKFEVPSKFILAGEHAVLRGAGSVAIPYWDKKLRLEFEPAEGSQLQVEPPESRDVLDRMLAVLQEEMKQAGMKAFPEVSGRLRVISDIPEASGLGSSAAVSVAVTRWIFELAGENKSPIRVREVATVIENIFHGKSSGIDVAAVSAAEPVYFKQGQVHLLSVDKLPRFTLHDTGIRASTKDCIEQVKEFIERHPDRSKLVDDQMNLAAEMAREGLLTFDRTEGEKGIELLAQSIRTAQSCFEEWGLVPVEVKTLMDKLLGQGAIATKLTGAGRGGFVLALWRD